MNLYRNIFFDSPEFYLRGSSLLELGSNYAYMVQSYKKINSKQQWQKWLAKVSMSNFDSSGGGEMHSWLWELQHTLKQHMSFSIPILTCSSKASTDPCSHRKTHFLTVYKKCRRMPFFLLGCTGKTI